MIISNKQILQLITIAHAHMSNCKNFGQYKAVETVQDILAEINDQQSEQLREIEDGQ